MEYQVDIDSVQNVNCPKYINVAQKTTSKTGAPNKTNNIPFFDNPNVRKKFVDIDGVRYPRDGDTNGYASNDNLDQNRDLKLFQKKICSEEHLIPFKNYTDMKNVYTFQVIDLRFQIDHVSLKIIN